MRTKFFIFAMLASVAASAQVTNVTPISANYTDKTVSFRVWWNAGTRDATHLSKVWVWVDYITVNSNNTTSGNSWTRALVSGTPTATAGTVSRETGNDRGFWLTGNASTNYSTTITVQLNITASKFNWCAYVSDYPPNVTATNGTYTFKGTPPFTLTASNGTTQTVTGTTLAVSALTVTPTTIKDKTECPGVFCIYSGSDLFIDAAHLCQQRTSGAQNWEAWIKDSRDNELYRIVFMPDNKWWLAQNVKYANTGTQPSWCTKDECGRIYTTTEMRNGQSSTGNITGICPSGWLVPICDDWRAIVDAVVGSGQNARALGDRDSGNDVYDVYGWQSSGHVYCGNNTLGDDLRHTTHHANIDLPITGRGFYYTNNVYNYLCEQYQCPRGSQIRCFRIP